MHAAQIVDEFFVLGNGPSIHIFQVGSDGCEELTGQKSWVIMCAFSNVWKYLLKRAQAGGLSKRM